MKGHGFEPVGVDMHKEALAIYRQAVGNSVQGDVTQIEPESLGIAPWLIWASPPCQPWIEGRRNQGLLWGFGLIAWRLLGNAVPVVLAEAVVRSLRG